MLHETDLNFGAMSNFSYPSAKVRYNRGGVWSLGQLALSSMNVNSIAVLNL